jgi:hypothetical protein
MMNSLFERIAAALGCIPDNADVITACQILESNGVGQSLVGWSGLIDHTDCLLPFNFWLLACIFWYLSAYFQEFCLNAAIFGAVDPRLRGDDIGMARG